MWESEEINLSDGGKTNEKKDMLRDRTPGSAAKRNQLCKGGATA